MKTVRNGKIITRTIKRSGSARFESSIPREYDFFDRDGEHVFTWDLGTIHELNIWLGYIGYSEIPTSYRRANLSSDTVAAIRAALEVAINGEEPLAPQESEDLLEDLAGCEELTIKVV
ncbi:MAG: hypothetical protein AAFV19_12315 [Pseudomonadota bacterium]